MQLARAYHLAALRAHYGAAQRLANHRCEELLEQHIRCYAVVLEVGVCDVEELEMSLVVDVATRYALGVVAREEQVEMLLATAQISWCEDVVDELVGIVA